MRIIISINLMIVLSLTSCRKFDKAEIATMKASQSSKYRALKKTIKINPRVCSPVQCYQDDNNKQTHCSDLIKNNVKNCPINRDSFNSSEALTISTAGYGITNPLARYPILATYGVDNCVILTMFDKLNNDTMLAHVYPSWKSNDIQHVIDKFMHDRDPKQIVAIGTEGVDPSIESEINLNEMQKILQNTYKISLKSVNIGSFTKNIDGRAGSYSIDSRTGQTRSYSYLDSFPIIRPNPHSFENVHIFRTYDDSVCDSVLECQAKGIPHDSDFSHPSLEYDRR